MENKNYKLSRRTFIKSSALAYAALTVAPKSIMAGAVTYDAKGLPTRILGKTGVRVPILVYGTGSRFMAADPEEGLKMLDYALNQGLYYWDTAASYRNDKEYSEERLGRILKDRRKEVFLATKVGDRDPEAAKRTIEQSFKRLQTDYIDLYQIHSLTSLDDAKNLQPVINVLKDYQRQGAIKFIGFTGHSSAEAMTYAATNYNFDTMLIALNHYEEGEKFEDMAVPAAAKKKMGIIGMKTIRPRETVKGLDPGQLIRYALSLNLLSAANVGMDSFDVINKNLEIIRNFKPLPASEMQNLRGQLEPFYRNKHLPWMHPGYEDGVIG